MAIYCAAQKCPTRQLSTVSLLTDYTGNEMTLKIIYNGEIFTYVITELGNEWRVANNVASDDELVIYLIQECFHKTFSGISPKQCILEQRDPKRRESKLRNCNLALLKIPQRLIFLVTFYIIILVTKYIFLILEEHILSKVWAHCLGTPATLFTNFHYLQTNVSIICIHLPFEKTLFMLLKFYSTNS